MKNIRNKINNLDSYTKTRLRLTFLYFFTVSILVFLFSVIIITHQLQQFTRFRPFGPLPPAEEENRGPMQSIPQERREEIDAVLRDVRTKTIRDILLLDSCILIYSLLLSYYLSGKTLTPIVESLNQQKRFVADASHEFKTPLTAIRTEAEVLNRSKNATNQDYKDFVTSTIEEIDTLNKLTTDLLCIAQSDNKSLQLKLKDIDLDIVIKHSIRKFIKTGENNHIQILYQSPSKHNIIHSDERLLEQLLNIIIDNAIKYNKPQGKVEIKVLKERGKTSILIKDTGIGIPKEYVNKIFDRFFQVAKDRGTKGFGLGLSIAKQICDKIQATITVESTVGKGTKIILTFPQE
jgi:two-component system sensor histidine kinase CiaH